MQLTVCIVARFDMILTNYKQIGGAIRNGSVLVDAKATVSWLASELHSHVKCHKAGAAASLTINICTSRIA